MTSCGALADYQILGMIEGGQIEGSGRINPDAVGPASLDLSLADEIYRIDALLQPLPGETVAHLIRRMGGRPHNWSAPLERECNYLARLNERFHLPQGIYGYDNPKSTVGRLDLHVRCLADNEPRFDSMPKGFNGDAWASLAPKSICPIMEPDQTISQARLFDRDTRLTETEMSIEFDRCKFFWDGMSYRDITISDRDGSLVVTIDTDSDPVGYRFNGSREPLEFARKRYYDLEQYFEPVHLIKGQLTLHKGEFYILSTHERIRVPPWMACEMVPMDERSGEFRSHYAGFIDPGWGWGKGQEGVGHGRRITLEVRPFEDIIIRKGQPIGKIRYELMFDLPKTHYDDREQSNYLVQSGPALSRHFKFPA